MGDAAILLFGYHARWNLLEHVDGARAIEGRCLAVQGSKLDVWLWKALMRNGNTIP